MVWFLNIIIVLSSILTKSLQRFFWLLSHIGKFRMRSSFILMLRVLIKLRQSGGGHEQARIFWSLILLTVIYFTNQKNLKRPTFFFFYCCWFLKNFYLIPLKSIETCHRSSVQSELMHLSRLSLLKPFFNQKCITQIWNLDIVVQKQ